MAEVICAHGQASAMGLPTHPWETLASADGGASNKVQALAAIAESAVFEPGEEETVLDEESRLLWQIMMIEDAGKHSVQPGAPLVTVEEAVEETVEQRVEETVEETVEQRVEETVEETVEQRVEETVEQTLEETVEETIEETVEETVEQTVEQRVEQTVKQTIEQTVEQTVEHTVEEKVKTPKETSDLEPHTEATRVGATAEVTESAETDDEKVTVTEATVMTANAATAAATVAAGNAASTPAAAGNGGGGMRKSTSTGGLSSLVSARSFRIRGKFSGGGSSSGGGAFILPALTVPDSPSPSDYHGPLSCSAVPSAAPTASDGAAAPPLTPSRRFARWFSLKTDKAAASSGDNSGAAAKSSAQFLWGDNPRNVGIRRVSSEAKSLGVVGTIPEGESEEGRNGERENARGAGGEFKDTSSFGLVSPKKRVVPFGRLMSSK